MVDTLGREYQVADGIDRLEDQDQRLVARGSPYEVEPVMQESSLGQSIVFSAMGTSGSSYAFPLVAEELTGGEDGGADFSGEGGDYSVSRGPQLLYIRIPISERKTNPSITLPNVSERLQLFHMATGTKVTGTVEEVDGFQFPKTATGSVRVDDLTFLIDMDRLSL
jgi:hypothetical protein